MTPLICPLLLHSTQIIIYYLGINLIPAKIVISFYVVWCLMYYEKTMQELFVHNFFII